MSVGKRLILLRKTLDLNQTDMAMVMGCSQVNISQYEKDDTTMSIKYLIPLRKAYNVNLDWLLLGLGEMFLPITSSQQPVEKPIINGYISPKKKDKLVKEIKKLSAELQRILQDLTEGSGD